MVRSTGILHTASTIIDRKNRKGSWTPSEDALLTKLMQNLDGALTEKHGARAGHVSWVSIAQHFERRNAKECRKRWKSSLCPGIARGSWSSGEDELLRQAMQIYPGQWAKVARYLGSRTGDQCSSRWRVLSAGAEWNEDRDRILLDYVNRFGKRWAEVRRLRLPMFTNAECRNRYHRIIRRLSADKRHEAEIETLKLVCGLDASECPSSSSSLSSAVSTLSSSSDGAAGLSPASRRTSVISSVSTSSSCGSSSGSGTSSCFGGEAMPWYAVDQRGQADDAYMPAEAKATMINEMALDQLMQLAGALVSALQPTDDLGEQQQQRRFQEESTPRIQDDENALMNAFSGFVSSNNPVAGLCSTTMPSPLATSMSRADGGTWTDVIGIPEYSAVSTAAATPPQSVAGPSTSPTAVPEMVPAHNVQTCRGCGSEPCSCDSANMWLSQPCVQPYFGPYELIHLGEMGSSGTIKNVSTSDSLGNSSGRSVGYSHSLNDVSAPLASSFSGQPLHYWKI